MAKRAMTWSLTAKPAGSKTAAAKPAAKTVLKTTAKPASSKSAAKPAPAKATRAAGTKVPLKAVKKVPATAEIKTMTGLLGYLAETADIAKTASKTYYASLIEVIKRQLKKEGRMALTGLGVFRIAKRARREGRNPRTGEKIIIKASKSVKFRMAKAFKEDII